MKMMKKLTVLFLCAVMILSSISGCGGDKSSNVGKKELVIATNSETGSLDPAGMIALTYLAYSVTALDELLTYDANGQIEYRAAESYEVNDELTEWTFCLRQDAFWSDGSPVTAYDFLNTMIRSLEPESGNGYANYLFPIKNAEAIYNGEAEAETLGVEIPDDYTLKFHLEKPCVYFLDLLRLPIYTPSCHTYADKVGSGWDKDPERSVANGPFYLTEYVSGQYFVLEKNPHYWNKDAVKLEKITYRFFDTTEAISNAYESGEVDVAPGVSSAMMEIYEGSEELFVSNNIATRYIYPNLNVEPLNDVRVRKAINLAINREELCQIVGDDTEPTVNFVAKYMMDKMTGNYFVDDGALPFEENVEEAKKLLAEAGYPDGEGFPVLTYNYPTLEMDSDTAQVVKEQLKKNLNIDIELAAQELQVNYTERRAGNFDFCRMNWTADFADPSTYLTMLLSNGTYNCSGVSDEKYDSLVSEADGETDDKKRAQLLHEAELYAVGEQFYIIPLYSTKNVNLIRSGIEGITQNPATGALEYRYAAWE